jgi:16S rRNA (guanine966-N2)-methyltransferase
VSLRIVAGEFRGRRIEAPAGRSTRPTREAVREAWFNVLGDRVIGARVLDLFAGSGALGFEALSRGAAHVHFVESDRVVLAVLRRNIEALGVRSRTEVTRADALRLVAVPERVAAGSWDLVLADPPYAGDAAVELVSAFVRGALAGILCVEHAVGIDFQVEPHWQRRYGETALSIFLDPSEGATHG